MLLALEVRLKLKRRALLIIGRPKPTELSPNAFSGIGLYRLGSFAVLCTLQVLPKPRELLGLGASTGLVTRLAAGSFFSRGSAACGLPYQFVY